MSHVVMKKNLAKHLMDSAMHDVSDEHLQKFGLGGLVSGILGGGGSTASTTYAPPPIVKQDFLPQIKTLQGQQADVYGNQKSLAQTLLDQSRGAGPNPAQMALNQGTGTNVANQAALMAGQRGASANPGAIARMAAQQGAGIQQNAVGQAATLEAQQQLEAQKELEQQYANMAGQSLTGEQIQQTGNAAQNNAITSGANATNEINATNERANAAAIQGGIGGLLNAAGPALNSVFGGIGDIFGSSGVGGLMAGGGDAIAGGAAGMAGSEGAGEAAVMLASDGGEIPRKSFSRALLDGGKVPGTAKVSGDSEKNDTEKTLLSPGEVVLPRSVTQAPDAVQKAAEFMKHVQDGDEKKGKSKDYGSVLEARKTLKDRVEHLEKLCMGGYARGA